MLQKPAIVAVRNPANTAPSNALHAILANSCLRVGANTLNKLNDNPTEAKLEKLAKANVAIKIEC